MQLTEYTSWFKSTFTACPIVKYEIRHFNGEVVVDSNLVDGTYLKFTKEYLESKGVGDPSIPSVSSAKQSVLNSDGIPQPY